MDAGQLQIAVQGIEQTAALAVTTRPNVAGSGTLADSALLGRSAELAALEQATRTHRWVTLVGLPGTGKSALLRAWLQQRRETDDTLRSVHIELNERSSAMGLAQQALQGLTRSTANRITVAAALKLLSGTQGLLVVDGLDQADCAEDLRALLTALGESCPGVRMVCASRRPFAAEHEHIVVLGSLSVRTGPGAEPAALSAAAQLFLQEALRIRPDLRFAAGADELECIASASGGLPLALKLAASWTRWLKLPAVAQELARCARGARGALDESLHGLLSWSWERLPQAQRDALHALALFPGPFGMSAAVTVTGQPAALIESLCAASLLETSADQPARLRLHALVRAFASQQGAAAPAGSRQAAARYIACVDDLLGPRAVVDGQPVFELARVAAVIDDLLAAWQLAVETGAVDAMGWLVAALLEWHDRMGAYRAGLARLEQARALLDESQAAEAAMLARLESARATLLYRAGDHDAAEQVALQARRLAEATGQRRVLQRALNIAGLSRWLMLRLDDAHEAFEAGLALALAAEDRRFESVFFSNLGLIDKSRGDFVAAEARWRRALQIDRELGDWVGAATLLNNLANLLRHQGRLTDCELMANEGLRLCREHGLEGKRPFALIGLALLHWRAAKPGLAADYLRLLDACKAETLESTVRAGAATLRADMALAAGDTSTALAQLGRALHIASQAGDVANRAEALLIYGRWLWDAGRRDDAERVWQTLAADTGLHATLRDEAREQLRSFDFPTDGAAVRGIDLALLTEQILQTLADDVGLLSSA
jgi:tetratricopeptide (TPR) repeat protein